MIETKRLILRPFIKGDANDVFEYLNEPLVNCFACMKLNTIEDAYELMHERSKDNEYTFAVVLKENNKVIGEIDAHPESMSPEQNSILDTFSPCWMLNKKYHVQNYAYEAAYAFLIIYLKKNKLEEYMHILKIIIYQVKNYAKN